jgi:hypothetical protein
MAEILRISLARWNFIGTAKYRGVYRRRCGMPLLIEIGQGLVFGPD